MRQLNFFALTLLFYPYCLLIFIAEDITYMCDTRNFITKDSCLLLSTGACGVEGNRTKLKFTPANCTEQVTGTPHYSQWEIEPDSLFTVYQSYPGVFLYLKNLDELYLRLHRSQQFSVDYYYRVYHQEATLPPSK